MRILTHDQLHRTAPAIFAQQPDEAVSERYGFVPTINVVDALQAEGWYPVRAQQTNVRQAERQSVARHLIRFRQDCVFQTKVATDSRRSLPPIPRESCH